MKRLGFIIVTLALFSLSLYVAFSQGTANFAGTFEFHGSALEPAELSRLVYSGFQGPLAGLAVNVMQALMKVTAGSIFWAIVILALMVELILLYPSVRIQLKQKKIHLFHKKLVDQYRRGQLSYGQTEQELHKLYAVNEKIHSRGAWLVVGQLALFLMVFWGLNLLVNAPILLRGSWDVLNFNLLQSPVNSWVPLIVSLLYFFHALMKIYFKEREDYISPRQTLLAIIFALLGSGVIYFFAGTFALALSLYFVTLIAFSTIRYAVVEEQAQAWGELAQKELVEMLRHAQLPRDPFEHISRAWNHLPAVRYINFHLLEEALSMSLGLLLALNFFGVFQKNDELSANILPIPKALAIALFNFQYCDNTDLNSPICDSGALDPSVIGNNYGTAHPDAWLKLVDLETSPGLINFINYSFEQNNPLSELPISCCLNEGGALNQAIKPTNILSNTNDNLYNIRTERQLGCVEFVHRTCSEIAVQTACDNIPGCDWTGTCTGSGDLYISSCSYQFTDIEPVRIASGCLVIPRVAGGPAFSLTADGGSGYYQWSIHRQISDDETGALLEQIGDGTAAHISQSFTFSESGLYKIAAADYFNNWNNTYADEEGNPDISCVVEVSNPPLSLVLADQPTISLRGAPVQLVYRGGPSDPGLVTWELVSGPGTLNPDTGVYTASTAAADRDASISVRVVDDEFPDNNSNTLTILYTNLTIPIELVLADQPTISLRGTPVPLVYRGGPTDDSLVTWELVSGPGTLNPNTGIYTPSTLAADRDASISVRALDEEFPDNNSNTLTILYTNLTIPIELVLADQPTISLRGTPVPLVYRGGPSDPGLVTWELVFGPGTLNPNTGIYTPSTLAADRDASISVRVLDDEFPDNNSNILTLVYTDPACDPQFGFYNSRGQAMALVNAILEKRLLQNVTYRFFIKHNFISQEFAFLADLADYPLSIFQNHATGFSETDGAFIDFTLTNESDRFGDNHNVDVYDPNVIEGREDCVATLRFIHAGERVRARVPKRLRLGTNP